MRIAINGAGIAGPALAWWLRYRGHEPILFERASARRTGGYIVDFWGSGYDVAERMGVLPGLREDGYVIERLLSVAKSGRIMSSMDARVFAEITDGRYLSVARSDLAKHLLAACAGIDCRYGGSVISFAERADGLDLTLSDGRRESCDLLVGADGLHSHIRAFAFGPQPDFERPLGMHVAAFVIDGYRPRDELTYVQLTRPGMQISRAALHGDRTLVLFVLDDRHVDATPHDPTAQKAVLHRTFGGQGWECDAILAYLDAADDLYFDRVSQIRMPRWCRGRVALVGDAAACPSLLAGEGSGLAMTAAYVLAGELHHAGGDHVAAFAAYEARLMDYVRGKQDAAVGFKGFFAPRGWTALALREMSIWLMRIPGLARRIIGPSFANHFALPEY